LPLPLRLDGVYSLSSRLNSCADEIDLALLYLDRSAPSLAEERDEDVLGREDDALPSGMPREDDED
jgi:hypothetical protein